MKFKQAGSLTLDLNLFIKSDLENDRRKAVFSPQRGNVLISDLSCHLSAAADVDLPADSHAPLKASPLTSG